MSSSETSDVDDYIEKAALAALSTIVPQKSRAAYEASYRFFDEWLKEMKVDVIDEKVMLAYFVKKGETMKASTMWSAYSKLRTTIYLNKNVDISKFANLIAYLKRRSEGYRAKKSKIFTKDEIKKFLLESNDDQYLLMKVSKKKLLFDVNILIQIF